MSIKMRIIGLVIGLALVVPWSLAWSGGEGTPPAAGVSGPEIWGVVVIDCSIERATLRVKTIDNCVVETDAFLEQWPEALCPATVAQVLWTELSIDLSGMGITGTPIITKVKNFIVKGDVVSFDAQIRSTP